LPTETCLGSQQNKEAAIWLLKHAKAHSKIEWQTTHFSFHNAYFWVLHGAESLVTS
jgi:hypothetical protein